MHEIHFLYVINCSRYNHQAFYLVHQSFKIIHIKISYQFIIALYFHVFIILLNFVKELFETTKGKNITAYV